GGRPGRGAGARRQAAAQGERQGPQLLRRGGVGARPGEVPRPEGGAGGQEEAALPLPAARDRAVGGGGPGDVGGFVRGVPRGRGGGREAGGAPPAPAAGALQGGGLPPGEGGRDAGACRAALSAAEEGVQRRLRRGRLDRQALPQAGRGGNAVLLHGGP